MCNVIEKCRDQKPFTGYKVVVVEGGNYYSYYSGLQYKEGDVS